ncbi:MAG: hypothetical protein U1E37_00130 [Sphingomonadaceae bacterium]
MTVLKWSAPFALAIALAASPAMAEETPHATVLDHRVREANYNDRQVYEIPGVFRIATEIVFAKDEVVEHVALGDNASPRFPGSPVAVSPSIISFALRVRQTVLWRPTGICPLTLDL